MAKTSFLWEQRRRMEPINMAVYNWFFIYVPPSVELALAFLSWLLFFHIESYVHVQLKNPNTSPNPCSRVQHRDFFFGVRKRREDRPLGGGGYSCCLAWNRERLVPILKTSLGQEDSATVRRVSCRICSFLKIGWKISLLTKKFDQFKTVCPMDMIGRIYFFRCWLSIKYWANIDTTKHWFVRMYNWVLERHMCQFLGEHMLLNYR